MCISYTSSMYILTSYMFNSEHFYAAKQNTQILPQHFHILLITMLASFGWYFSIQTTTRQSSNTENQELPQYHLCQSWGHCIGHNDNLGPFSDDRIGLLPLGFQWNKAALAFIVEHRPHSRQVTGARCTEVAARQSWAEYSSRPTTHSRAAVGALDSTFD